MIRSGVPVLALDTSTSLGSVALGRDGVLLGETVVGSRVRHAESLLPAMHALLTSAQVTPQQIGALVVGAGPGSFTGVRIAGATAKGLARALGIPLYAYSALAAVAAAAGAHAGTVCAMFDAQRDEVYAAAYRFEDGWHEVMAPAARAVRDVAAELARHDVLYAGEGARKHAAVLESANGRIAPALFDVPRASALLWLAEVAPAEGLVNDVSAWEPAYLRPSGAERVAL